MRLGNTEEGQDQEGHNVHVHDNLTTVNMDHTVHVHLYLHVLYKYYIVIGYTHDTICHLRDMYICIYMYCTSIMLSLGIPMIQYVIHSQLFFDKTEAKLNSHLSAKRNSSLLQCTCTCTYIQYTVYMYFE